ncbi:MAG TPA: alpha/beta hydrolase [Albitalea sp.]|nr:alpha/beta hydrolase [Albitalea sp.]
MATWFEDFQARPYDTGEARIFARSGGRIDGPPLLLLHGFPQTHAIWHRVARVLADRFFLVMPDLRGYGDSSKPPGAPDHSNYSKRAMADDMVDLMRLLGHQRFGLVGHDRGGRVAHRLALDHPQAVSRLMLIDIAPTLDMYDATDMRFASYYYHWFHLIQPAPLPEKMIGGDPVFYLHRKLGGWGANGMGFIEREALAEYERCFCSAEAIHGACEDYRAAAGIDLEHDRASRQQGQKVACDLQVLWGTRGIVELLFDPLSLWRAQCAGTVTGRSLPTGHFVPEEAPDDTAAAIAAFFGP